MSLALYDDHFIKPVEEYNREPDLLSYYVDAASNYLTISTGKPLEECRTFVKDNLKPGGLFPFKDPKVLYLDREENGDRVRKETTLNRYLRSSVQENEIIAPTFTTYVSAEKDRSLLSIYIETNVAKRDVAKIAYFKAKAEKNTLLESVKKVEQTGRKLANNAMSGAHVSPSTPLFNKSAHSTLTSTCRITSAYGNANNEKFITGNRHYFNHHIVLNNITAVITTIDYVALEEVMTKYNIHYPTHIEVMEGITYSSSLYWWDKEKLRVIGEYVAKLNPLQCAAFLYSGDAYHLRKHNEVMVREFLDSLSKRVNGIHSDPMSPISNAPAAYIDLAHQICYNETKGIGKDYSKIKETEALHTLALTVENIATTIHSYADLIKILWMPETVPASVANFPSSVRRSAITGDTDSTIFTVQDWVIWHTGTIKFTDTFRRIYATVVFLAATTITHLLAKMSANIGIEKKNIFTIQMKSEYSFDVFIPTQLGKHYFACMSCQEGNVKQELEYEIKGVGLRSANAPVEIIAMAKKMMQDIIADTMERGEIVLFDYLKRVADIEREIVRSVKAGELTYLRSGSIKDAGSYAGEPRNSPYQNHFFWNEVFGVDYGMMPEPAYGTRKVPVNVDTPTKLKSYLASLPEGDFKIRMTNYLVKNEKTTIGVFNFPSDILVSKGIPKEVFSIIDYTKLQLDICRIFYIILETLGYYAIGDKNKRLISNNCF